MATVRSDLTNYKTEVPAESVQAYERIERNRQDLVAKRATKGALAYARFLLAVESDASLRFGRFGKFAKPSDSVLVREYPFLKPLVEAERA